MFFFIIIVFFVTAPLVSQENPDTESFIAQPITSIEVIGLRRTRPHIIMMPLEKFIGLDKTAFDQEEVFETVRDTRVLRPVSAELIENEDSLILQVTVKERWTIYPFPLFMPSSDEFSLALFLLDTNSFGIRDVTALGGIYTPSGWSVMTRYMHTPTRGGSLGWNVFFMYGHRDREVVDRDKTVQRIYSVDQLRISPGLFYSFTDIITGSFSMSYSDINLKNSDDILNPPERGASVISFTPGVSFRQSSRDGYFTSSQSFSLEYSYNYAVSGTSFHQAEYRGSYEKSLIPGFRLIFRSGGVWKSLDRDADTAPLFEEGPEIAQVEILPGNYMALHYAGFSAGLEKSLFRSRFGILSIHGSWQGVFSSGTILESEFNHGPAGGINFYIGRAASFGVGGIAAYNMISGKFQFSFNIGMGMPF